MDVVHDVVLDTIAVMQRAQCGVVLDSGDIVVANALGGGSLLCGNIRLPRDFLVGGSEADVPGVVTLAQL